MKITANKIAWLVAMKLIKDKMYEDVGYNPINESVILKVDGKFFELECRQVYEKAN